MLDVVLFLNLHSNEVNSQPLEPLKYKHNGAHVFSHLKCEGKNNPTTNRKHIWLCSRLPSQKLFVQHLLRAYGANPVAAATPSSAPLQEGCLSWTLAAFPFSWVSELSRVEGTQSSETLRFRPTVKCLCHQSLFQIQTQQEQKAKRQKNKAKQKNIEKSGEMIQKN